MGPRWYRAAAVGRRGLLDPAGPSTGRPGSTGDRHEMETAVATELFWVRREIDLLLFARRAGGLSPADLDLYEALCAMEERLLEERDQGATAQKGPATRRL